MFGIRAVYRDHLSCAELATAAAAAAAAALHCSGVKSTEIDDGA